MRVAEVCPTCATYVNAVCVIYTGPLLEPLNVFTNDNVEEIIIKINDYLTNFTSTGEIDQDNLNKFIYYRSDDQDVVSVTNYLNALPTFAIGQKETLYVSVTQDNTFSNGAGEGLNPLTYLYILDNLGKGAYGVDGVQLTPSDLALVSITQLSASTVENLATTQFIDLGDVGADDIVTAFNAFTFLEPIQNQIDGYVLIDVIINGQPLQYLFVGAGGNYGTTGTETAVLEDFVLLDGVQDVNTIDQDNQNLFKTITVTANDVDEIATFINTTTPFSINQTQNLYLEVQVNNIGTPPNKYIYVLKGLGKGTYGLGETQITGADLEILSVLQGTLTDIFDDPTTQFIELGTQTGTIDNAFNNHIFIGAEQPVQNQNEGYVVVNVNLNSTDLQYLFIGDGGTYGLGGLETATIEDFILITDLTAEANTQFIDIGEIGTSLIEDVFNAMPSCVIVQDQVDGYVIIDFTIDGVPLQNLFVGEGGSYGSGCVDTAIADDFIEFNPYIAPSPENQTWTIATSQFGNTGVPSTANTGNIIHNGIIAATGLRLPVNTAGNTAGIGTIGYGPLPIGGNYGIKFNLGNGNHGSFQFTGNSPSSSGANATDRCVWSNRGYNGVWVTDNYTAEAFTDINTVNLSTKTNSKYISFRANPQITGTGYDVFSFYADKGKMFLGDYGQGNITGTATYALGVDVNGNVLEIPVGGGGGALNLQGTTDLGNETTNPIISIQTGSSAQFSAQVPLPDKVSAALGTSTGLDRSGYVKFFHENNQSVIIRTASNPTAVGGGGTLYTPDAINYNKTIPIDFTDGVTTVSSNTFGVVDLSTLSLGGGGAFIPLAGTEVGSPVTGDIQLWNTDEDSLNAIIGFDAVLNSWAFTDASSNSFTFPGFFKIIDGADVTIFSFTGTSYNIGSDATNFKGLTGSDYYGANYTDNTYVQKKYVDDNFQPLGGATPNLDAVTTVGAVTANSIDIGGLTVGDGDSSIITFNSSSTIGNIQDIGSSMQLNHDAVVTAPLQTIAKINNAGDFTLATKGWVNSLGLGGTSLEIYSESGTLGGVNGVATIGDINPGAGTGSGIKYEQDNGFGRISAFSEGILFNAKDYFHLKSEIGKIRLLNSSSASPFVDLDFSGVSGGITVNVKDESGTLALTSDIAAEEIADIGTVVPLTNVFGIVANSASANATTTYTTTGTVLNAYVEVLINAASQPTVTGGTLRTGETFVPNTDMYMIVSYKGATRGVEYYFSPV